MFPLTCCYLFTSLLIRISGLSFDGLPEEINVHIFDYLSITDVIESLLLLNNRTYHNYFLTNYQADIKIIKEIEYMIDGRMHKQLNMTLLTDLIRKVRLNELYALRLPLLLKTVSIKHKNNAKLLTAMNIQTMTRNEFDSMPYYHYNDTLKLLIYSSRNLAPFSFTEKCINDWHFSLHGDTAFYPWLTGSYWPCSVHKIYFGHLYEYLFDHFHKELQIPTLDRLYLNQQSVQRQNIIHFIEKHGFIPWHRNVIKQMVQNESTPLHHLIDVALYRIHQTVFDFTTDQNLSESVFGYMLSQTAKR